MGSVFPSITGLDVNGLLYRYTTIKNPEDNMKVHVGNKNANGVGYLFRETDDWSGVDGNTIVKYFPLANIPSSKWGDGSIEVEGTGSVTNATVLYNYRIDECYNPQANELCAGYVKPVPVVPVVEIYDATEDEDVAAAIDTEIEFEYDSDGNIILEDEEEEEDTRLEMGLTASANALTLFKNAGQADIIMSINLETDLAAYYNSSIGGGVYNDNNTLTDSNLPDNSRALRNNFAQQLLHDKMINMQYNK
tara:strand:+ start:924 stop:1670 length:747 start_codon:yes stop_codon:yes gene_type:complete